MRKYSSACYTIIAIIMVSVAGSESHKELLMFTTVVVVNIAKLLYKIVFC